MNVADSEVVASISQNMATISPKRLKSRITLLIPVRYVITPNNGYLKGLGHLIT